MKPKTYLTLALFAAGSLWLVAACQSDSNDDEADKAYIYSDDDDDYYGGDNDGSYSAFDDDDDDSSGTDGDGSEEPPDDDEISDETQYRKAPPQTVGNFVFILNSELDSVYKLEYGLADSQVEIEKISVGRNPTQIKACRDRDETICSNSNPVVLNRFDSTVSIINLETNTTAEATVRQDLNNLILSPSGDYAIAYYSEAIATAENNGLPPVEGGRNDLTLIDINSADFAAGSADSVSWAIGLAPSLVRFTPDGARAVILSKSRVSVIDLSLGLQNAAPVSVNIGDFSSDIITPIDMEITADGKNAFVIAYDSKKVYVVDLENATFNFVSLPTWPTDLDLWNDGAWGVIVAQGGAAENSLVLGIYPDPASSQIWTIAELDHKVGSAAVFGTSAVLFTNANSYKESSLTVIDLQSGEYHRLATVKPIDNVYIAPGGRWCLVDHRNLSGNSPISSSYYNSHRVVTVLSLASPFPFNPIALADDPILFDFTDSGAYGLALIPVGDRIVVFDMAAQLDYPVTLDSEPLYMGSLPGAERAFISQSHSLGRISFIDAEDRKLSTITGFELNSEIKGK